MASNLLNEILTKLDRGSSPRNKWPDAKGDYWPLCPYHNDRKSGSFSVGEKGFQCFSCGESGGLQKLASKLGVAVSQHQSGGNSGIISLNLYVKEKRLPIKFLTGLGIIERKYNGYSYLRIPYYDLNGQEVAVRRRLAMTGKGKFRWNKGSKLIPYGLWKLDELLQCCSVDLGVKQYIFLVEGESDAQTLWHHKIPALGVPGANVWKPEWVEFIEDYTVFLWQEPDRGGEKFVERVGQTWPEALIVAAPQGRKDISNCHVLGDDIPSLLQKLARNARPFSELIAERSRVEAADARSEADELLQSNILEEFEQLCKSLGLVGEEKTAKILYLALTSRVLDKPVSVVVKGPSSGGKSFTVETVLKAFPMSAYYALSSMSEKALAYSEEPLEHRMLVIFEAAGVASDFGSYLLRTLLSEGSIRYETVEKTQDGLKPRLIERQGPTGLLMTTTWTSLHPENETRILSITVKDDTDQTRRILVKQAERANGSGLSDPDLRPWHALQTWLELAGTREVTIPYAPTLADMTNAAAVRLRRDFVAVINLIRSHAILYQCQRDRDNAGRIVATIEDYRSVYELVIEIINEGVELSVSRTIRETVEAVQAIEKISTDPPSIKQVADHLGLDKSAASRRIRVATHLGYLTNLEDKKGKPARLILGEPLPNDEPVLPIPDDLEKNILSYSSNNAATAQHSFVPSPEWQEIPEGVAVPPGGELRMDFESGKNFGRWPNLSTSTQVSDCDLYEGSL